MDDPQLLDGLIPGLIGAFVAVGALGAAYEANRKAKKANKIAARSAAAAEQANAKADKANEIAAAAVEESRRSAAAAEAALHLQETPDVTVELGMRNPDNDCYELLFTCERAIDSGSITLVPGYNPGVISGLAAYGDNIFNFNPIVSLQAAKAGQTIRKGLWAAGPEVVGGQSLKLCCEVTIGPKHWGQLVREVTFPSSHAAPQMVEKEGPTMDERGF
jgi:hypothetical protein